MTTISVRRARLQEREDPRTQRRDRVLDERRQPLRVEEHHARPPDGLLSAIGRFQGEDEEVALVIEAVLPILEVGKRLTAESLQELEVLLSPLEGLFHRDHPVSKHPRLRHGGSLIRSRAPRP